MPILYPASNRFKYARSASDFRARRYAIQNPTPEPAGYDPIQDFANGEQGFIYDISDLSTLFQDVAGTIPAVVGLSVARINDKSGNGNHAIQVTPTSRAILRFVDGKYRIQTDGTDDWYITPTITPGTDKVQLFVGFRNLRTDRSNQIIIESAASPSTTNGNFSFWGSLPFSELSYAFTSKGTIAAVTGVPFTSYPAPITNTIAGLGDISGDRATLLVNGVQVAQNTGDQGTGNYLPSAHYLFRRNGATVPLQGMISSVVCRYGPNLTPEQIANMDTWTNERAGAYL